MAQSAQELLVILDATTERLRREMRRADQSVNDASRRMDRGLNRVDSAFSRLNSGAAAASAGVVKAFAAMGVAVGAAELVQGVGNVLDRMQEIQRTAAGLGISTKAVQELTYTFRQFHVEAEDVTEGLAQLSGQAQGALTGSTSLIQTWGQLGITVDQLRGKKPDELFRLLAQGIAQTHDPVVRLSAASTLLGEDLAGKLMPLLVRGAVGLDKFAGKANDLHVVLNDKLVKSGAAAAQALKDIKTRLTAEFTRAVAENADQFTRLAESLGAVALAGAKVTSWFVDSGKWLGEAIARQQGYLTLEDKVSYLQGQIEARERTRQRLASTFGANDPRTKQLTAEVESLKQQLIAAKRTLDFVPPKPNQPITIPIDHYGGNAPAPNAPPAHQFRPLDGFLAAVDEAHNAKFQSIDTLNTKLKDTFDLSAQLKDMGTEVAATFASGFTDAILSANSLGEAFKSLIEQIGVMILKLTVELAVRTAIRAVMFAADGAAFGAGGNVLPFAKGGVFGVDKFANGGVVTSPTPFRYGGNRLGMMGEAGPEAIMPLTRGRGGKLGVQSTGVAPQVIIIDQRSTSSPPVEVQQRRGPDSQHVLEITVRDTTQKLMDRGDLDSAMSRNYGVRRGGRY